MAENRIRKDEPRRPVVIIDVSDAIELLINNKIIQNLDLQSPVLTVMDVILYRYPFIDNLCLVVEIAEQYGNYNMSDKEIEKLLDLLTVVNDIIYNELMKYFTEEDILLCEKLCWINDSSIAFIL